MCAAYVADEQGRMKPVGKIERCPWADEEQRCDTYRQGFRDRITGPGFPIQIIGCKSHGRTFTVYPMGFGPYGRRRMAPVDVAGNPLEEEPGSESESLAIDRRWESTIFRCSSSCGR